MITVVFWVFLKTLFMMLLMTLKDRESNAKIMMVIFIMSGHVPRNMRVALNMIDLAAPYIHLNKFEVDKKTSLKFNGKLEELSIFTKPSFINLPTKRNLVTKAR